MKSATAKQRRILSRACAQLFTARCFTHEIATDSSHFARVLNLGGGRMTFLTDRGLEQLRTIVGALSDADLFAGEAAYGDYWTATKSVLEACLSKNAQPESGAELIEMVVNDLRPCVKTYTFAVALQGVQLESEEVPFGAVRLARPAAAILDAAGVTYDGTLTKVMELMGPWPWLIAEARGTGRVARRRFTALALLFAGLLATYAACRYERGATGFRVVPVISPLQGAGRAAWLSWSHDTRALTTSFDGGGKQLLKLDAQVARDFAEWPVLLAAIELVGRAPRTPLEDAIVRAIYWFGDAHRDPFEVMQLVKYWSCVECFFSSENERIVNAVSTGLAAVLLYGDYEFGAESDYCGLKARIKKLYDLRSRALHGASYQHVTSEHVAQLSQWVAWMLFNMISLSTRGFTTPTEIGEIAVRLDSALSGVTATAETE